MATQLFKPVYKDTDQILKDLKEIMDIGWTGLGGKTAEFEKVFAETVKAPYAVGLNSATASLHLALTVAGVGKSKYNEVITTPMTFISTNHAILYQWAIPVWCDINNDLGMEANRIEDLITPMTKAIMLVHYSGLPVANMKKIYEIAAKNDLWVIEDAAHACGAYYTNGMPVGSSPYHKSLTCFSFHSVKNLNTGDGGMITCNNEDVAAELKKLRWLGIDKDTYVRTDTADNKGYNWLYNVDMLGYKYHMNDITAVIGLNQIKNLRKENAYRRILANRYKEKIDWQILYGYVGRDGDNDNEDERLSSNHIFVILAPNRDSLIRKLNEHDIFPGVHYYPNHLYPIYRPYYRKLLATENLWKQIISLPLHLEMSVHDIDEICDVINSGW
ncbi:MAG: DegT/DnrJ/EryC1/StrS family aminotransferase [Candidatus Hodarchaeales archaeon]|jgi:perosamine synthetase